MVILRITTRLGPRVPHLACGETPPDRDQPAGEDNTATPRPRDRRTPRWRGVRRQRIRRRSILRLGKQLYMICPQTPRPFEGEGALQLDQFDAVHEGESHHNVGQITNDEIRTWNGDGGINRGVLAPASVISGLEELEAAAPRGEDFIQ